MGQIQTEGKQVIPHITIKKGDGKVVIYSGYTIFYKQFREGGRISCAIPSYDIYFSADSQDKVIEKGRKIVKMYIDHFMSHSKNKLKDFLIQIHTLGFKANNDSYTIKSIMDNKDTNAKFNSQKNVESSIAEQKKAIVDEMELAF